MTRSYFILSDIALIAVIAAAVALQGAEAARWLVPGVVAWGMVRWWVGRRG